MLQRLTEPLINRIEIFRKRNLFIAIISRSYIPKIEVEEEYKKKTYRFNTYLNETDKVLIYSKKHFL